MEIIGCLLVPIGALLSLATQVFWIWMLIDCAMKEKGEGNTQVVWIIVIVFTNIIGAAIYFFIRRPERIAEYGE